MAKRRSDPMQNRNRIPEWYDRPGAGRGMFPVYEHLAQEGFPTVEQFRGGIVLGCIAHALYLAANEDSDATHGWDGDTYYDDNMQGETWAAAFTPQGAVAVFYSNESERNPFPADSLPYDQARYFRGMPKALRAAKERALSCMLNLYWNQGGLKVVTAAMWADGEQFTANEPWESVFRNALWACYRQLLPVEVALIEWQMNCDLDDEAVAVVRALYLRRVASTEPAIPVEPSEMSAFRRRGTEAGLEAAQAALADIGITLTINE